MIFLADMRKIEVPQLIFIVEIYKQAAIADGEISHMEDLLAGNGFFDRLVQLSLDI